MINFVLDGIITVLLVTTIGYSWRLSKRIKTLQESRGDLNAFLTEFNESIERADANISALKELGEETDNQLVVHINKARFLANDLSFLNEKGEDIADSLEFYISSSRNIANGDFDKIDVSKLKDKKRKIRTPAKNTPSAIAHKREAEMNASFQAEFTENDGKQKALETLIDEIAKRKANAFQPSKQPNGQTTPNRTAEQEAPRPSNANSRSTKPPKPATHGKGNSALFSLPKNPAETRRANNRLQNTPVQQGLRETIDT